MSELKLCVADQVLKITNAPIIASGGVNETKVVLTFCDKWDGFIKTALFYRDTEHIYYSVLDENDTGIIPWEVYTDAGTIYISVIGEKGDTRRTSTVVRYKVGKGVNAKEMLPSEPSPDVYDRIIAMYEAARDGVIAGINIANGTGEKAVVQGAGTTADGENAHAQGQDTVASGKNAHAEGRETQATAHATHAEGYQTQATSGGAHAEGNLTVASGIYSHAEGQGSKAVGSCAHAEGTNCEASGAYSHAEGGNTKATGMHSHAEGAGTIASGMRAHAEGQDTQATELASHAEGGNTIASGARSHAEGHFTVASGASAHAEGTRTIATGANQHAQGRWNIEDAENKYAHIVGNGNNEASRSNAHTLDWSGNAWYAGIGHFEKGVRTHGIVLYSPSGKPFTIKISDEGSLEIRDGYEL